MRTLIALRLGVFLALVPLAHAAETLAVGQSVKLHDTVTVPVRPTLPFSTNTDGTWCDIQEGGTLTIEQMPRDFSPRYNRLKLVPYVGAVYAPPAYIAPDRRRDNPCRLNARIWVEREVVEVSIDKERKAREKALGR